MTLKISRSQVSTQPDPTHGWTQPMTNSALGSHTHPHLVGVANAVETNSSHTSYHTEFGNVHSNHTSVITEICQKNLTPRVPSFDVIFLRRRTFTRSSADADKPARRV